MVCIIVMRNAAERECSDKFVPLQTKQRYSTRDISGEVFLTLFFRGFVPFLSLADFVSRDNNLQVADLQRLKLYFGGLVTATTSKQPKIQESNCKIEKNYLALHFSHFFAYFFWLFQNFY